MYNIHNPADVVNLSTEEVGDDLRRQEGQTGSSLERHTSHQQVAMNLINEPRVEADVVGFSMIEVAVTEVLKSLV